MTGRKLLLVLMFMFAISPVYADLATADSARARGDYETAIAEYRNLAEAGDGVAQATLGYMIYVGEGITQNYAEAVSWYRQAAMQGNADAQYNLAVAFAFGEGVAQDFTEAGSWYTQAAEQNHAIAQYSLGLSYAYGEGVKQDPINAAYWFSRAAENGYVRAQVLLGSKYHTGDGVSLDYEEAARWYRAAAEQGDAIAQFNLGSMYRLGTGVSRDVNEAMNWYRLSSEQGYTAATDELNNLERALSAQRESQPRSEEIVGTGEESDVEEMEELATPTEDMAAISEQSETYDTEFPDTNEYNDTREDEASESASVFESLSVTTATAETVTTATAEGYSELMTMDNLDPSLPDEDLMVTEQLFSDDTNMQTIDEPDSTIAAAEPIEPEATTERSGGFFSRLFSRGPNQTTTNTEPELTVEENTVEEEYLDASETESLIVSVDVAAEVQPEPQEIGSTEEEKPESRGLFSRLFSRSDRQNNSDPVETTELPDSEQLAMAEPESAIEVPLETVTEMNFSSLDNLYEQGLSELAANNYTEALSLFRSAAAQGDPMAQYQLGTLYYQGLGVRQNYSEAALWYRRAAEQGNVDAQYSLGNMYLMGEGIPQNDVQAQYWYNEAATQGHTSAKHNLENLDRFSKNNELTTEDISKEIEEIDISLSMNVEQAMEYETTESQIQATENMVATIEPAVQLDAPKSLPVVDYERGLAYSFGEGVGKNLESAFEYFKNAAEKDYAPAQYKLGVAFAYAEGTEQDNSQAVYWYRKAALQGHKIAQRNLGVMYENGEGIEQDKVVALAWYSILADSKNVMDVRRMQTLASELSSAEIEAANRIKNGLLAEINVNRL